MSDDGGPAFACAAETGHQPGMSLRDYLAALVMNAMALHTFEVAREAGNSANEGAAVLAMIAYNTADAMLAHRAPSLPGAMSGDTK
jgi:hypothetical protein